VKEGNTLVDESVNGLVGLLDGVQHAVCGQRRRRAATKAVSVQAHGPKRPLAQRPLQRKVALEALRGALSMSTRAIGDGQDGGEREERCLPLRRCRGWILAAGTLAELQRLPGDAYV
jgi:hypothetical protein